ncbi:essential neutral sphingomyelinase [Trypanosoma equiperdum]|uniref:Sphingomyelin phosphodiesterase, putative n=2 Tax=Trypanozoon TaxID=39700 RepID=Q57U95_TRYB2|nr:Sphingomyelin phosphodiesterase, putative [Trypanosoma brucei brucei TREU927]AAX70824.1 Sphingomyelin phosphodiesterase, putative [Trypanosoma brucei]AAZ11482.1 Sphingomyelin phosphodiesterase, putative [Trypanosoma brucei brucei TREU927]SCU68218.1 essential neutral sphingomyelinase [Trypanosoma equiperdum]
MAAEITVLTFNLWGIFNSKHRPERMAHFASKVEDYDIILLQEQFSESDFDIIIQNMPEEVRRTRYFKRYPTAFYGSGIAVISRFPVKSGVFFTFPLQGFPEQVLHGDYYANKGAAMLCVSVPCNNDVEVSGGSVMHRDVLVYSTHLVAVYQVPSQLRDWRDEVYLAVRLSQAISFANFIIATSNPTDHIIIGGDFNSELTSMEIRTMLILLRGHGYCLRSVLPVAKRPEEGMSKHECIENLARMTFSHENKFTCTDGKIITHGAYSPVQIDHIFISFNTLQLCSYEDCPGADAKYPFKQIMDGQELPAGVVVFRRNDEVFLGSQSRPGSSPRGTAGVRPVPSGEQEAKEMSCPLSDHYGVAARLRLLTEEEKNGGSGKVSSRATASKLTEEDEASLCEAVSFLEHSVKRLKRESRKYIMLSIVFAVIMMLCIIYMVARPYLQMHPTRSTLKNIISLCHHNEHPNLKGIGDTSQQRGGTVRRIEQFLKDTFSLNLEGSRGKTQAVELREQDYEAVASVLHGAGLHNIFFPLVAVVASIMSFCCLVIALLNRKSYAKIISDQITELGNSFLRHEMHKGNGCK